MLKNVTGEVSITWGDKTVTKSLSGALTQLALVTLTAVLFTSIMAFVILSVSMVGFIALFVISTVGLGAGAYFGKDYLTGMLFKGAQSPSAAPATTQEVEPATASTTESDSDQAETAEAKA